MANVAVHINNTTKTTSTGRSSKSDSIAPIIKATMAMLILTVNTFVLILFLMKSKLRRNISNKILLSLVSSDFATGFILLLHVLVGISPELSSPESAIALTCRIFLDIITAWLQLVNMGNLSLIIFERYITLIYPYKSGDFLAPKRIILAIRLVWVISFFVPNIPLIWLYPHIRGDKLTHAEEIKIMHAESIFSSLTILLFVLLPMVIFFVAFARMFIEVRKFPALENLNKKKEEKRVLIIFAAMYTLFLIFSVPYFLVRLLLDLALTSVNVGVSDNTRLAVTLLKSLPPFLNPFLYVLNKPDFRKELLHKREHLSKVMRQVRFSSIISRKASDDPSNNSLLILAPNNNNNNEKMDLAILSPMNTISEKFQISTGDLHYSNEKINSPV